MTLDGPFTVYDRDPASGELTAVRATGQHYKTDPPTFAANAAALSPFRVQPAKLQSVWAGDDPQAPSLTVSLRFPDAATAAATLAHLA